ncbi:integrase core domain-containing protein [Vreelandella olivaria]
MLQFKMLGQASTFIGRWVRYYNEERSHYSLSHMVPRARTALAS